jgi:hypothetical protein
MTTPQEKAKQQAEVMLAFANGAEIEWYRDNVGEWQDAKAPQWDWSMNHYRVKVVPKVVKYYCYSNGYELKWVVGTAAISADWKPIPSEDKEVLMP